MINFGKVDANSVLYIPFTTYGTTGGSITLTGLAVTDIEIYKDGSTTQRASDNGYALLDTDGIDFDGITGLHGFSIDLSDNTTSGFYAAGSQYWVVVSAVTVDSQTVNFLAATFQIGPVSANVTQLAGDTQSLTDLKDFADAGYDPATNKVQGVVLTDTVTTYTGNTPQTGDAYARLGAPAGASVSADVAAVKVDTAAIKAKTDNLPSDPADASVIAGLIAGVDAKVDIIDTNVDAVLVDTGTDIPAQLNAIAGYIDTEIGTILTNLATVDTVVDAIQAKTDNLPSDPADASVVAGLIAAVEAKIDIVDTNVDAILDDTGTSGVVVAGTVNANVLTAVGVVEATAITGTLTTTTMTTDLTEATDDHYNGRSIVFTSGALNGQATDITDYTGSTKLITMTALTEAPTNGTTFKIV